MSICTVSELRSALGVGTLYPDATLQSSCDAADAVIIPMLWKNEEYATAHSNEIGLGTLYFDNPVTFYVGQSVTVSNSGTYYNGTKTITGVGTYSITFVTSHTVAHERHPLGPFATVAGDTYVDWTLDSAVQEAALMIAVDIWQARQTSNSGGSSPDFQPSPYRMGNTLMARVRGLLAHALDPRSMVG
jgi:hypothetical protein